MRLTCPHCGYDGSTQPKNHREPFRFLEDIVCWRAIQLDGRDGILSVEGLYHTGDGYDDGDNARIECGNCMGEFALPEGTDIEWR